MVKLDGKLLEKNRETEIFSAGIAADRIEAGLAENRAAIAGLAREMHRLRPRTLVFVGSGASWCTLYTGYWFLRTSSAARACHLYGPELLADAPAALWEEPALAILASYSGKTADTLEASEFLREKGVPRIALSRDENGPLARGCEHVLAYRDKCLYTSAMANLLALLGAWMVLNGEERAAREMTEELERLPDRMRSVLSRAEERGFAELERVKDDDFFYVLGDGALWALAYQYGYTNLMEYSRVHAACLRASEWRHGPLEVLFRRPAMIHLVGSDRSRGRSLAARDYCAANGGRLVVFDVEDWFPTHPALAPFALHPVTQSFLLAQATSRGIDMDDYLQMHVRPYLPGETYF